MRGPHVCSGALGDIPVKKVLVYHLLCAKWALDDLAQRRLKVAVFSDLNDPFELLSAELSDRATRRRFVAWRKRALAEYGVLCFSKTWKSPALWSHYADKHKGICLGFEVPDNLLRDVTYLQARVPLNGLLKIEVPSGGEPGALFRTKYEHWEYEKEVRRIVRLDEARKRAGRWFWPFGNDLELKEVVAGARCTASKDEIEEALGTLARSVSLTKARLAFTKFEVVIQQLGFEEARSRTSG